MFKPEDLLQEIFNRSNRQKRREILHRKNRRFTKKGYAFGNKLDGHLLAIAEHFYRKEHNVKISRNKFRTKSV